ncbi:MAG: S26 family signal peptidase [Phycisphaerae bacterium]
MSSTATIQAVEVPEREGIKDTLESITIALILAFVFRAFIVEAFVIPTGSMAPTLYGAHGTIICENCGVEFAYGVKDLADTRQVVPVRAASRAICPNCNHPNTSLKINDNQRNAEKGDRILVLKWPFDIGGRLLDPKRWDVIVFKDPADGVTNFIKRQVGLPNEVLMIVDGDVYTVPTERLSPKTLAALDRMRHDKYELRTEQQRGRQLRAVPLQVLVELDKKMTIARKTPVAQQALWFRVYDHDYPPQTLDANQPRWTADRGSASGWDASTRRVRFEDRGLEADYIALAGKQTHATCAYNIHSRTSPPPVSDLRVRFVLTPGQNEGTLRIRLEKLRRAFWATIRMNGLLTLTESAAVPTSSTPVMASKHLPPFTPGKSVEISFENVDYRLSLAVSGKEVLTSSDDRDSPAHYGPNLKLLRRGQPEPSQPPRIYGEGGPFELTHLVVDRDAYYYHNDTRSRAGALPWAPRTGWGSPQSPILLRENEFFMLGDNTSASKDSRLWDQIGPHLLERGEAFQLGTVPRDQLIGKAFFVYWPSGHRMSWLPPIGTWKWSIIPDVGRMRWVR